MASYTYMMSADEVAQELNCSKSHAYKLVKAMNKELAARDILRWLEEYQRRFGQKRCMAMK